MDLFPEIYGGDVGITALQYAIGTADQTPAHNSVVELFNPALAGTQQRTNAKLLTLTGIVVWGAQAAAANLSVWFTTNSAVVNGAVTLGPNWMDHRRSVGLVQAADAPLATLQMGDLNPLTPANSTEIFRTVIAASQVAPFGLPFNEDIDPGTGVLITVSGAARTVISPIWIERQQTG